MATLAEAVLPRASAGRLLRLPGLHFPFSSPSLDRALVARFAGRIAETEVIIDLGDRIGSWRWWRGFATLGGLVGALAAAGLDLPAVVGSVPLPRVPAVAEEARLAGIGPLAAGSPTGRQAPPTALAKRLAEAPERPRISLSANVGAGGLEGALRRAGVGRGDLDTLATGLSGWVNMRGLKPGTRIDLVLGRRETKAVPRPLEALAFRAAFDMRIEARRRADGSLEVKRIPIRIDDTPLKVTGEVGRSLERAARAAGLPASVIADYRRQLSHVVDFQREVSGKDRFEIVVEHRRAETGETEMGRLIYAGLLNGRDRIALMRWGPRGEFFGADGESVKKGLMRTPVSGARMASGFGMRFHPILGYSRMHQGVDFAAASGTPILASAAGTVVQAGWGGGYGNVVVIDHGRGMKTRYAHMRKFAVRAGQKVGQGQVIGQVGSTGLSTGPHLHYEVWLNGKPVNPRQAKFAGGEQLTGEEYRRFRDQMARMRVIAATG